MQAHHKCTTVRGHSIGQSLEDISNLSPIMDSVFDRVEWYVKSMNQILIDVPQ